MAALIRTPQGRQKTIRATLPINTFFEIVEKLLSKKLL